MSKPRPKPTSKPKPAPQPVVPAPPPPPPLPEAYYYTLLVQAGGWRRALREAADELSRRHPSGQHELKQVITASTAANYLVLDLERCARQAYPNFKPPDGFSGGTDHAS